MDPRFVPAGPALAARRTSSTEPRSPRHERRRPYRVPCRVRLVNPTTGEVRTVVGETVNLSAGGLAMHVSIDAPVGTWIETLLPHPSGNPRFVCGRVVRVRRTMSTSFELGVEITGADDCPF